MQRTLYHDGIEVDESDLNNTENSKIAEIIVTRTSSTRFGVIEGLTLTVINNALTVGVGKASLPNGEIIQLTSALTGLVGASFDAGRASFFGLRLTEATSNPKPHESDPITQDTRASAKPIGEFFVAADATDDARSTAKNLATTTQTNDGNFILLGEVQGTGVGIVLRQNTPLPRTKLGDQPGATTVPKTAEQKNKLNNLYEGDVNNESPIHSAKDDFHRSLIGTGIPSANNPHGLNLNDIGGDKNLQNFLLVAHTNGILGFEPSDDDFTPASGSFAFSTADAPSSSVTVAGIVSPEQVLIRGQTFDVSALSAATTINFTGKAAGLYYIAAKSGSDTNGIVVDAFAKGAIDGLVPLDNGTASVLNQALELSSVSGDLENKYVIIGLVRWNGSNAFTQLSDAGQIPIPGMGTFFNGLASTDPYFLPAGKKTLDLRKYGTISSENVQKRSLRLDRLVTPVVPQSLFQFHSGLDVNGTALSGQGLHANINAGAGGNTTLLKHLTDADAWFLFGHRGARGVVDHAAALHDGTPNDLPQFYGFQTSTDKWKQDNLTMTILRWSDLNAIDANNRSMGDANATAIGNLTRGASYAFCRNGWLQNIAMRLGDHPNPASQTVSVSVSFNGGSPTALATFTSSDPDGAIKVIVGGPGVFPITASPGAPGTITMLRQATSSANAKNLTVTAEYHFTS